MLSIARTRHAKAIVDDREARSAAKALGVSVLGTLGVVLLARAEGRIMSAADVLRDLRHAGLRLDDSLVEAALKRFANEEWMP